MGKWFKKAAVTVLIAAMFLQQTNIVSFADEAQAEAEAAAAQAQAEAEAAAAAAQAQAEAEAAAAAQAQAEAEAAAQAQAEAEAVAQAQAEVEAAAQAQAEAEAAAQAQAEAEAAAQAQAEAEAAAQAQAESQAASESETQADAQTETAAPETETKRSARENSGYELTKDHLRALLADAMPYLFVAESLEFSGLTAEDYGIPESWILDGADAGTMLASLKGISLELADTKTSGDLIVVNLYADENGTLDTTQLSALFPDHAIDVSDSYYLVNVIADSQAQVLDFSGYKMEKNGTSLTYTDETQPGHILYNFAALDDTGTAYVDYTGTIRISKNMQGTILAPAASVEIGKNLAGAVYAENVSVRSSTAKLLRIVFPDGAEKEPEEETEAASQTVQTFSVTPYALQNEEGEETFSLGITASFTYNGVVLTAAEKNKSNYIALFTEEGERSSIVGSAKRLTFAKNAQSSGKVSFEDLPAGIYYVTLTQKDGTPLGEEAWESILVKDSGQKEDDEDPEPIREAVSFALDSYPDGFKYEAELSVTKQVTDREGEALESDETFYVSLFETEDLNSVVKTFGISMDGRSEKTETVSLMLSSEEVTCFLAETDASGTLLKDLDEFAYTPTYAGSDKTDYGEITLKCGEEASETIINKLKDSAVSTVSIQITDPSGNVLNGSSFAIKDEAGNIITTFDGGEAEISSEEGLLTDGETYSVYEINAEEGYLPEPAVEFTVEPGDTTEVTVVNREPGSEDTASLTVTKSVYVGEDAVYANGETSDFYFALFSDDAHTQKVSNVLSLTMSGFTTSKRFEDLALNERYYLAETDENGIAKQSDEYLQITYSSEKGEVTMNSEDCQISVRNTYSELPAGYCYTGDLTVTKKVTNAKGEAINVTNTFYIGLFRNEDREGMAAINLTFNFQGNDSVSVPVTITLPVEKDPSIRYYIAETDSKGYRIDEDTFEYTPEVDKEYVTIGSGNHLEVVVTNQAKSGSSGTEGSGNSGTTGSGSYGTTGSGSYGTDGVYDGTGGTTTGTGTGSGIGTVYLDVVKRVYEGTDTLPVDETFYIGLFRDFELTELITSPIEMPMEDSYELTKKVTLNLGDASSTTVYIAEVDAYGQVIENFQEFGYDIEVGEGTYTSNYDSVTFTKDGETLGTVVGNFLYGTTTESERSEIMNNLYDEYGINGSGELLSGGELQSEDGNLASSVQTGDETPFAAWALVMGSALAVFVWTWRRRQRTL